MPNSKATVSSACHLGGELQERIEKSHTRLIELIPVLFTAISDQYGMAEFAANWISAMAMLCEQRNGQSRERLWEVSEELLGDQQDYGGFAQGQNPEIMKIGFWVGDARGLMGLLAAWKYFDDPRYLQAAERSAEAAMNYWPTDMNQLALATWDEKIPLKVELYFALFLPGFVDLYQATKKERYLSFARHIHSLIPRLAPRTISEHADGRMFALFGAMDLYEASGQQEYLDAALHDQRVIAEHFQWLSGGTSEIFPENWRDEACQTANWLRVNLRLWRLTGREEFLATAERTWRNHLYMNQHPNGGFCWGRTLLQGGTLAQRMQTRMEGTREIVEPFEMYYCCTETAPRALLDIGCHAVCDVDGSPSICFWTPGTFSASQWEITILDDLEPLQPVRMVCVLRQPARVKLRIPQYMKPTSLSVDDRNIQPAVHGNWITVELPAGKHALRVAFEGRFVMEDKQYPNIGALTGDANNSHARWIDKDVMNFSDKQTASFYGPWMLKSDVTEDCWFVTNQKRAETLQAEGLL